MGLIYKATNLINGKVYIGLTTQKFKERQAEHFYESKKTVKTRSYTNFHKAIREFGKENFIWEIIFEEQNISIEELNNKEKYFIKLFQSNDKKIGYNMTEGGDGFGPRYGEDNPFYNQHHTDETRQHISQYHLINETFVMEKNPAWKGGRFKHKKDGVIYIRNREHPSANKSGYVLEHKLVMEEYLGRYLTKDELIIHINGVNDDNRLENLKLTTRSEYGKNVISHNKGNIKDITGQKFGSLTPVRYSKTEKGVTFWLCRCDCGKEVEKRQGNLVSGNSYRCGSDCIIKVDRKKYKSPNSCHTHNSTDLIGKRFGTLTVLSFSRIENYVTFWICKCDCGKIVEKRRGNLTSGNSKRCSGHCSLFERKNKKKKEKLPKEKIKKERILKTHCHKGHPLEGNNLILEHNKDLIVRRCRICRDIKNKNARERNKLKQQQLELQNNIK